MAKRGPKPKSTRPTYWSFRLPLYSPQDDDLIALRDSIPPGKRQSAVKGRLRTGAALLGTADLTDDDELTESSVNFLE